MRGWAWLSFVGCVRSCGAPDTGDSDAVVLSGERNVVVLVLDGVRIDESFGDGYSTAAGMQTADILPSVRSQMWPHGALVKPGYATGITITAPGHVDLVTGARNVFGNYPNGAGEGAYLPDVPTLFEELRRQHDLPAEAAMMGGNTSLVLPAYQSMHPGYAGLGAEKYSTEGNSDPELLILLRQALEEKRPRLAVINLHNVDRAGHYGEVGDYAEQAQGLDPVLLSFWQWLQTVGDYGPNTVLVLVADHGRHRLGNDEDWRGHGDHCGGCREIPMFLIGPGIAEGAVVEAQYSLTDLSRTLAHLLDVELPYSDGVLITEVLADPPEASTDRSGAVWPAAAGGQIAAQIWQPAVPRSVVAVDGEVVSGEGLFAAEAPVLHQTSAGAVACWRALEMDPGAENMPWYGVCARDTGSGWQDMNFPQDEVWPLWSPSLVENDVGTLFMAMVANSSGIIGTEASSAAELWVMRYDDDANAWLQHGTYNNRGRGLVFPTHARLASMNDGVLAVAYGTSNDGDIGRWSRRIDVLTLEPGSGWTTLLSMGPATATEATLDLVVDSDRLERPALASLDGDGLLLGALSYTVAGEVHVVATQSADGDDWSGVVSLGDNGRVFPHLDPVWDASGALVWAQKGDGDRVEICKSTIGGAAQCVDTGAAYVMGLAVDGASVVSSVRGGGESSWEIVEVNF